MSASSCICITAYSSGSQTTTTPGENVRCNHDLITNGGPAKHLVDAVSVFQSSALYSVHLSAAPCTEGGKLNALEPCPCGSRCLSGLPIAPNHGRKAPPPIGRHHSFALYQPIYPLPPAHAWHMAHSLLAWPLSLENPLNPPLIRIVIYS